MTTLIANQIERLNKAKVDIKASIIAKGGIVPDVRHQTSPMKV